MIRLGLCCIFRSEPITFRRATAKHLLGKPREERLQRLADICRHNALALEQALHYCKDNGIGAFRINSQILPLKTHPDVGYAMKDLPGGEEIVKIFRRCGTWSRRHDIRTTFHPDQFIVLNSPDPQVVARSVADLVYHAEVAQWVHADVINLHAGGVYGDKKSALTRLTGSGRCSFSAAMWIDSTRPMPEWCQAAVRSTRCAIRPPMKIGTDSSSGR